MSPDSSLITCPNTNLYNEHVLRLLESTPLQLNLIVHNVRYAVDLIVRGLSIFSFVVRFTSQGIVVVSFGTI